eukprot:m.186112 g.186112  ORF g.186112 m.186112 type:complete len:747 (-) comp16674_c0_seq1:89-2329(-)
MSDGQTPCGITPAIDLVLVIRRALAQASTLSPEAAYFVATTAANDAQQSLSTSDIGAAAAVVNDQEELSRTLGGLAPPPNLAVLERVWRGVCLVHPTNSAALAQYIKVIGQHVDASCATGGPASTGASAAHVDQCRKIISLLQSHPAATRPMAEQLAEMQSRCNATASTLPPVAAAAASPVAWTAAGMPPAAAVAGGDLHAHAHAHAPDAQTAASVVANGGVSPVRPKLQPTRTAPPLPNAWPAVGEQHSRSAELRGGGSSGGMSTTSPPSGSSPVHGQPQQAPSPQRRRPVSTASPSDRAHRVRSWLKTLRLHKYCNILEQMNYEDMVALTETDLEKLGISAKGARAKMLKSINGLKSANQQAEKSLSKFNAEVRAGVYADTFAGLTQMLEPDQAAYLYGPRPEAFDTAAEFMSTVKLLYASLVLGQSRHKPHQKDVLKFFNVLDKALRHEHFPVEDKKVLFGWKNECQRVLSRPAGDEGRVAARAGQGGAAGVHRLSPEGQWGTNGRNNNNTTTRAPGGPSTKGNKHRNTGGKTDAWTSPTRNQRAASFGKQSSVSRNSPTSRDRGNSFGSSQETVNAPVKPVASEPTGAVRESKSEERLAVGPPSQSVDAFGFGPVSSIWGSSIGQPDAAPSAHDPVFGAGSVGQDAAQNTSPGTPGDMRHIWQQPHVASGNGGVNAGTGHHQIQPNPFGPAASADNMDAAAVAWFQNEFSGAGTDASSIMQSIVMGASGAGLPENKRNTANF